MSPGREGPKGWEGVCGKLGNLGGGAKYSFSGSKCPPSLGRGINEPKSFWNKFGNLSVCNGNHFGFHSTFRPLTKKACKNPMGS